MQSDSNRHGAAVIEYQGKRGKTFRIKYRDASGEQVMETVGAERDGWTRRKAEAELRDRLSDVRRKAYVRPKQLTFDDWAATWYAEGKRKRNWKPLTVTQYGVVVRHLAGHFGKTRLDGIRPRDVTGYIDARLEDGFSAKTIQLHLNVLSNMFKAAIADELVTRGNPVATVERPKVPRNRWRILEPREVPAVAKAFTDTRFRLVFLTLMLTGLRRSEIVALRWRDLDLLEGTLRVVESKSEEGERLIAIPPTLARELADHYTTSRYRADNDHVFAHPERGSRLDAYAYHQAFQNALTATGVEGRVRAFHDMRHTALTNLAATGASPIAVMATAGHRSMATTNQYLHLAGVVFRRDADALERRLLGRVESSTHLSEPESILDDREPLNDAESGPG